MPAESNVLSVPKSSEKLFQRGFKAWCDNTSLGIRTKLGLEPNAPLSPYVLAEQMNVTILELGELEYLPEETKRFLSKEGDSEWSAVTVEIAGQYFVVINPSHSPARKSSNIMHELAHIIRGHKSGSMSMHDDFSMRSYDELQENEANWFAGSLLLTRDALFSVARQGKDPDNLNEELARYGVSKSLYNWRLNVTGVRMQLLRMSR
jgi:Zn-dependent peptidase ImmA (M78 family)